MKPQINWSIVEDRLQTQQDFQSSAIQPIQRIKDVIHYDYASMYND